MDVEVKNVILFLLEQGAIGCSRRHWVKVKQGNKIDSFNTKEWLQKNDWKRQMVTLLLRYKQFDGWAQKKNKKQRLTSYH